MTWLQLHWPSVNIFRFSPLSPLPISWQIKTSNLGEMKWNETKKRQNERRGIFWRLCVSFVCCGFICMIKIKYIIFWRNRHFPCHTLPLYPSFFFILQFPPFRWRNLRTNKHCVIVWMSILFGSRTTVDIRFSILNSITA